MGMKEVNSRGKIFLLLDGALCVVSALFLLLSSFTAFNGFSYLDIPLKPRHIGVTLVIHWLVELSMLAFGGICFLVSIRPSPKLIKIHLASGVGLIVLLVLSGIFGYALNNQDLTTFEVNVALEAWNLTKNLVDSSLHAPLALHFYAQYRLFCFIGTAVIHTIFLGIYRFAS